MNYSIKVTEAVNESGNIKGYAAVTLGDSFKLSNISIVENPENGNLFVAMPSYKTSEPGKDGDQYKDYFNPITADFRNELYGKILETYAELHDRQAGKSLNVKVNEADTEMPQFTVRVTPYERTGSNIKGLASICFNDNFVVNNVTIRQSQDNKPYVAMPSYKSRQVDENGKAIYKDFCNPVTAKFREKLYGEILGAYEKTQQKESVVGKLSQNKDSISKSDSNTQPEKGHERSERSER